MNAIYIHISEGLSENFIVYVNFHNISQVLYGYLEVKELDNLLIFFKNIIKNEVINMKKKKQFILSQP